MRRTRHEKYIDFSLIPFVFHWKLVRTVARSGDPANWHENLEIQYCHEGEGYILIDGKRHNVKAGDIIVANSNSLHFTGTDSNIMFSVIIVDIEFCKEIGIDYTKLTFEPIINNEKISQLFVEIYNTIQDKENPCRAALLKKYAIELMVELRQGYAKEKVVSALENPSFSLVKEAIAYIQDRYAEHFSLEDMANALFVDKYNLARKFKEHTGNTIIKYTNRIRCEKAKILIVEGMPVHEAARNCGFNNMSFFTKTFKSYIGKTPSAYKPNDR